MILHYLPNVKQINSFIHTTMAQRRFMPVLLSTFGINIVEMYSEIRLCMKCNHERVIVK